LAKLFAHLIARSEEHLVRSLPFECGVRHYFIVGFDRELDEAMKRGDAV